MAQQGVMMPDPHKRPAAHPTQRRKGHYENSTICEADLREMQDHSPQGTGDGHLRKSKTQAKAGLMGAMRDSVSMSINPNDGKILIDHIVSHVKIGCTHCESMLYFKS